MKQLKKRYEDVIYNEKGAIGYLLAWLLGVPASVLLIVFLIRGGD